MIAQINARRVAAGKSHLGWLNPSIYALTDAILLNDITSGHNKCCANAYICCAQGFYANEGWDPLTGIGSVNYTAMLTTFMDLGDEPNVPTLMPSVFGQTNSPVVAPTYVPTITPTMMPTQTAGWVFNNKYEGIGCQGEVTAVQGAPTQVCLLDYNATAPVGSIMYYCGVGKPLFVFTIEVSVF